MRDEDGLRMMGHWWLPEEPEHKVQGSLEVDEGGAATLRLDGVLNFRDRAIGEIIQGQVVFGQTSSRKAVTLLDARGARGAIHGLAGSVSEQTVIAHTILVGRQHPASEPRFSSCTFSYDGLAEWAEPHFRMIEHVLDDAARELFDKGDDLIRVKGPASVEFTIGGDSFALWAGVSHDVSFTSHSARVDTSWRYEPEEPKTLDELLRDVVQPLKYLHILFTGEPTKEMDVRLEIPKSDRIDPERTGNIKVHADWISGVALTKRRSWEWPVVVEEVIDRLPSVVELWLEIAGMLDVGLPWLFSVLGKEKDLYVESRFLTLTQAAEAYHRHHPDFGKMLWSEDEHQARLQTIRAKVPSDWGEWPMGRLVYAYEPTQRQRLRELVRYAGDFGEQLASNEIQNRVIQLRNEVAHMLEPSIADEDERYTQMFFLGEKLRLLLQACLLKDIGIPDSVVTTGLLKSQSNTFAAEYRPAV